MTDQSRAAERISSEREFDEVVDSCLLALNEHSTERLRRVADEAYERNPDGWLSKMIREYLDVWR